MKALCAVFLLATFGKPLIPLSSTPDSSFLHGTEVLGAVDTSLICNSGWTYVHEHSKTIGVMVGFLYEGFPAGIAASVISLATNILSTLLVGYKAW